MLAMVTFSHTWDRSGHPWSSHPCPSSVRGLHVLYFHDTYRTLAPVTSNHTRAILRRFKLWSGAVIRGYGSLPGQEQSSVGTVHSPVRSSHLWLRFTPRSGAVIRGYGSLPGQEQSSVVTVHSPVRSSHPWLRFTPRSGAVIRGYGSLPGQEQSSVVTVHSPGQEQSPLCIVYSQNL